MSDRVLHHPKSHRPQVFGGDFNSSTGLYIYHARCWPHRFMETFTDEQKEVARQLASRAIEAHLIRTTRQVYSSV